MTAPLTIHAVLARFDRALGLDVTPRTMPGSLRAELSVDPPVRIAPAAPVLPASSLAAVNSLEERVARLAEIATRHASACQLCAAASGHRQVIFGEGAADAEIMFVGEAPGEAEERAGRPFAGPAGEKLDEMIRAMGLTRADVYMTSVMKSRLPDDRAPTAEDIAACGPYLLEQVLAVQPRVIVTLGGPATKWMCGVDSGISRIRGTWQTWTPPAGAACQSIPVMPTYHPSYVLRTYTRQVRAEVWSDLRTVLARIGRSVPTRPTAS